MYIRRWFIYMNVNSISSEPDGIPYPSLSLIGNLIKVPYL